MSGVSGPPHDLNAERALLGALLIDSQDKTAAVYQLIAASDFYKPAHATTFEVISRLRAEGAPVDTVTVHAAGGGDPEDLADLYADAGSSSSAQRYAQIIRGHAASRSALAAAVQFKFDLEQPGANVDDVLVATERAIAELKSRTASRRTPPTLDEFLAEADDEPDWAIPDLLEHGDRVIITASEGVGKSTLLRQIGVQTAAGVHPFTVQPIIPLRVLLVDVENSERLVRTKLRELRQQVGDTAGVNLRLELLPGVDLLDAHDAASFEALVADVEPDLLLVGPLYKLASGDPTLEETARAISTVFDRIRAQNRCALAIEAHTPHDRNEIRPYGASLWKRWPEFGIHLGPDGTIQHWRGQRDERDWPTRLRRGQPGEWPWTLGQVIDVPAWDGPTHCKAAVLELLDTTGEELSPYTMTNRLKAIGKSYRRSTISVAAEQLAAEDRINVRNGPRDGRLFKAKGPENDPTF